MISLVRSVAATTVALTVIIAGSSQNLETAIKEYQAPLLRFIRSQVRDRHAAEDILQKVACTVSKKAGSHTLRAFAGGEDFRAHLFKTATNKIHHYNRARARSRETAELRVELDYPARRFNVVEDMECCDFILASLEPRYARALRMEFLGAAGAPEPPQVRTRALQAAQRLVELRGMNYLS